MNTYSRGRIWLLQLLLLGSLYTVSQANITVKTFLDANSNGSIDPGETLINGLSVIGYDELGTAYPFMDDGNGTFILDLVPSRLRIQVSGYNGQSIREGVSGPTSVFFASDGDLINVPVLTFEAIDLEEMEIVIPCYEKGAASTLTTRPGIVSFPYQIDGIAQQYGGSAPDPTLDASIAEVGSTWGIAYQMQNERIFASTIVKRHVDLGPHGPGAIYTLDYSQPDPDLDHFDLQGYAPSAGPTLDFGAIMREVVDGVIDETTPYALSTIESQFDRASYDIDAFDKVGKMSYGDIDVTEDGRQLWMVNLYQRSLVQMDISGPQVQVTRDALKNHVIDDIPGLPDMRLRFVKCINAGGIYNKTGAEAFTDPNGIAWDKNRHSTGGTGDIKKFAVVNTMNSAEGTTEQDLYRTWRKGSAFSYNIPVPLEETYTVTLHFAEPNNYVAGDRKFDVVAEGQTIYTDFDVVAQAGASHKAMTVTFQIPVTGPTLDLDFLSKFGNKVKEAILQGIIVEGHTPVQSGILRPWGLNFHNGKGYLGLISDGSITQTRDHLFGYIMSFNPNNIQAGFTEELSFPLNYPRERASNPQLDNGPQALRTSVWMPWADTWEKTDIPLDDELSVQSGLLCAYPQPIISDIDFTEKGDMIITMMDRWAHQVGYLNYSTILGNTTFIIGYAAGDILKAFKENSGYDLEKENFDDGQFFRNDDGPSYDGEFFHADGFNAQDLAHHGETITGGSGVLKGSKEVVVTVHNPQPTELEHFRFGGVFTQGVDFYDTDDGSLKRGYLFVDQFISGKANGLGDIEFATAPPLVEVGNYVWCDANANGIQDPIEFGLPGVELMLHDKENSLEVIDQITTDANGEYVFTDLLPNHCYEIRIDISQLTALGFSGMTAPLMVGMDTLIDSNADPDMVPGFAVAMFCTDAAGNNRHDIDFGFGGPVAANAFKLACEDASGCATFDLSSVDICVDASQQNTVMYYPTFNDADSMIAANEITGTIDVCDGDTTLFARVMRPMDPMCYSIAQVTLREINLAPVPPAYNVVICPAPNFDALAFLQGQGFRGDATTELFLDMAMMMPVGNPVPITMYPMTIYFDDTVGIPGCGVSGAIHIDSLPASSVEAGADTEVCGLQCVDLTTLGASFSANGSGASSAIWTTSGSGTFVDDNTFAGARLYCPDTADMLNGSVTLTLQVTDDQCGRSIADVVTINILPSTPMFLPDAVSDTIDCPHPFVTDQVNNDTFPRCRLVANCVDTITATVVDYTFDKFPCDPNISKRIIRKQCVVYNKVEYCCTDTIYVRGLDFDLFMCPPERDSVYCHTDYLRDENGHPHPTVTGVPTVDSIPLWPPPDRACEIAILYKDFPFDSECPELIRREWHIKNNCSGLDTVCYQWLMIFDTLGPYIEKDYGKAVLAEEDDFPAIDNPVIFVPTSDHDCEAHTYLPSVMAIDTCTDVKMVKATIEDVGSAVFTYNDENEKWETHKTFKIPKTEEPLEVIYEAIDFCHNISYDTCYFFVKDFTKPVTICDKGVNVTLSDTMVWLPAEVFDEGSWDNCGINLLLARRADWATACGVNLCDSFQTYCYTAHHDSIYCPVLETDKHINPVEAHYAKTLEWLCEDDQDCSDFIIGGWWYDLLKHGTLECIDHPYPTGEEYFKQILTDPSLQCYEGGAQIEDLCTKHGFDFNSNLPQFAAPLFSESDLNDFDIVKQIGGGWSKEVPFCCEDACQNVVVEVLAMDYWCNWSKCWTTVYVEDKSPPKVVSELFDVSITCNSYQQFYADAVDQALEGDFTAIDTLLGGYDKVAYDDYDNLPEKTSFTYYNVVCDSIPVEKDTLIFNKAYGFGYVWKTITHYEAVFDTISMTQFNGQIADDCGLICIQEKPWVKLDHCGNGFIKRTFKFVGQCIIDESGHRVDTIVKHQTIWITSDCDISKSMFRVPQDLIMHNCGLEYDPSGSTNASGVADPSNTGWPEFIFEEECRQIGIGYYDQVFKIVGGDEACYKIIRTWCFADWCVLGGEPNQDNWWLDDYYEGKLIKCTQKIILIDTVPPQCSIEIPDSIEAYGCYYNLRAEVIADDSCGVLSYAWELINDKTGDVIALREGQLNNDISDRISVEVDDLLPGVYALKVQLRDDCQNETICKETFEVFPKKKPSPVCLSSITLDLTPMDTDSDGVIDTAMGTVWASEFNISSRPACGSDSLALIYRLDRANDGDPQLPGDTADQMTFGCDDIGAQVLRMYVLDESGAWDYCEVILIVQDNSGGCDDISSVSGIINGVITTEQLRVIKKVDVVLQDQDGSEIDLANDVVGSYEFTYALGKKGFVKPSKEEGYINGVSTRDMIEVQRHILGEKNLDSWYQKQAADVNADGRISVVDIIQMRKLILAVTDEFPDQSSWQFFNRHDNGRSYHINPMESRMRVDFIGVKTGDINNDHDPSTIIPRGNRSFILYTPDHRIAAGETRKIQLSVNQLIELYGYQFTLQVNPSVLRLENYESGDALDIGEESYNAQLEEGWISTAWFDAGGLTHQIDEAEVLIELTLTALEDTDLSDALTINGSKTAAEAYDDRGQLLDVSLTFGARPGLVLYQNRPNPFDQETVIAMEIPKAGQARLTIFDVTGKAVFSSSRQMTAGYQEWTVRSLDLPTSSVLYYKLETGSDSAVRKMILMNH